MVNIAETLYQEQLNEHYGELEDYYVREYHGITEVYAPHETRMYVRSAKNTEGYFSLDAITAILTEKDTTVSIDSHGIYNITGKYQGELFVINLSHKEDILEISLMGVAKNVNFEIREDLIPTTDHPFRQETENPAIILYVLMLLVCYQEVSNEQLRDLILTMENISDRMNSLDEYYLNDLLILVLSVYSFRTWYPIKTITDEVIPAKMRQLKDQIYSLEQDISKIDPKTTHPVDLNKKARHKSLELHYSKYNSILNIFNQIDESAQIQELKVGIKSYFILLKNDKIYTFNIDKEDKVAYTPMDDSYVALYFDIFMRWPQVFQTYQTLDNQATLGTLVSNGYDSLETMD